MLLLVSQRKHLKLGDVLPVGDLFDVIAHGDEAFNQEMAIQFENAKRLYHQKLLPLAESQHGVTKSEVDELPPPEPYHVLAQQVMALCLQQSGIGESQINDWLKGFIDYASRTLSRPSKSRTSLKCVPASTNEP